MIRGRLMFLLKKNSTKRIKRGHKFTKEVTNLQTTYLTKASAIDDNNSQNSTKMVKELIWKMMGDVS